MLDGIDCPENMGKCMTNNYCFIDFWKNWHKAFNLWLVRYLYIPLGGNKWKVLNIWVVFGFVALWHDLSFNLLAWGWGMCIFIMPEVIIQNYFAQEKFYAFRNTLKFCWLASVAGGFDLVLMTVANLIGFSFGIKGFLVLLDQFQLSLLFILIVVFILNTSTLRIIERFRTSHTKML